jgi:hypothetical protein
MAPFLTQAGFTAVIATELTGKTVLAGVFGGDLNRSFRLIDFTNNTWHPNKRHHLFLTRSERDIGRKGALILISDVKKMIFISEGQSREMAAATFPWAAFFRWPLFFSLAGAEMATITKVLSGKNS